MTTYMKNSTHTSNQAGSGRPCGLEERVWTLHLSSDLNPSCALTVVWSYSRHLTSHLEMRDSDPFLGSCENYSQRIYLVQRRHTYSYMMPPGPQNQEFAQIFIPSIYASKAITHYLNGKGKKIYHRVAGSTLLCSSQIYVISFM